MAMKAKKRTRKPGGGRKPENPTGVAMKTAVPLLLDDKIVEDADYLRQLRQNAQSRNSVFREAIHRGLPLLIAEAEKAA